MTTLPFDVPTTDELVHRLAAALRGWSTHDKDCPRARWYAGKLPGRKEPACSCPWMPENALAAYDAWKAAR